MGHIGDEDEKRGVKYKCISEHMIGVRSDVLMENQEK